MSPAATAAIRAWLQAGISTLEDREGVPGVSLMSLLESSRHKLNRAIDGLDELSDEDAAEVEHWLAVTARDVGEEQ